VAFIELAPFVVLVASAAVGLDVGASGADSLVGASVDSVTVPAAVGEDVPSVVVDEDEVGALVGVVAVLFVVVEVVVVVLLLGDFVGEDAGALLVVVVLVELVFVEFDVLVVVGVDAGEVADLTEGETSGQPLTTGHETGVGRAHHKSWTSSLGQVNLEILTAFDGHWMVVGRPSQAGGVTVSACA
jgi:hypothetical protein